MSAQLLCAILLQLGSAGDKGGVDITITTNETKSGEFYNIKTFTVASGVTLTASEFIIIRAEKIIINGTISADGVNMFGINCLWPNYVDLAAIAT